MKGVSDELLAREFIAMIYEVWYYLISSGVPNGLAAGDGLIAVPLLQGLTAYAGTP
jgi:hypothetical protein